MWREQHVVTRKDAVTKTTFTTQTIRLLRDACWHLATLDDATRRTASSLNKANFRPDPIMPLTGLTSWRSEILREHCAPRNFFLILFGIALLWTASRMRSFPFSHASRYNHFSFRRLLRSMVSFFYYIVITFSIQFQKQSVLEFVSLLRYNKQTGSFSCKFIFLRIQLKR